MSDPPPTGGMGHTVAGPRSAARADDRGFSRARFAPPAPRRAPTRRVRTPPHRDEWRGAPSPTPPPDAQEAPPR